MKTLIKRKAEKPSTIPSFNVITQNILGMKTEKDVEHFIQTVIFTFKPALLFLTEVDPNVAERVAPPDYTLVRGTLSGETNILGWTFLGVYREWCHGGRSEGQF